MAQGQKLYKEMACQLTNSREERILVKEVLAVTNEAEAVAHLAVGGYKPPFRCTSFLTEVLQCRYLAEATWSIMAAK